jgi:alkaline phosphatase D
MTKIAFASCMHVGHHKKQKVWGEVAAHNPDWLILGGDNIYMNYGPAWFGPRRWSPEKFAKKMLKRYTDQFSVPSFHALVESIPSGQVIGVWDDHDFAWNNSYGTSLDDDMPAKSLIARAMFHHYFAALNQRPLPAVLPQLPLAGLPNLPNSTTPAYRALDIGPLRVFLCDVRSYREKKSNPGSASLLGESQEKWLFSEIKGSTKVLIVSGSTMTDGKGQSWDIYSDFYENRFRPVIATKIGMFLGGDIHKNRLSAPKNGLPTEVVSSGAAIGLIFGKRNFGVLDVSPAEVGVRLVKNGVVQFSGRLDLATGAFT